MRMQALEDRAEIFRRDGAGQHQNREYLAAARCSNPMAHRSRETAPSRAAVLTQHAAQPCAHRAESRRMYQRNSGTCASATAPTSTMGSSAITYDCQCERKIAPTTGKANTIRNAGFCKPPALIQMKADDEDAGDVQRRHHTTTLTCARTSPQRGKTEVNRAEREQSQRDRRRNSHRTRSTATAAPWPAEWRIWSAARCHRADGRAGRSRRTGDVICVASLFIAAPAPDQRWAASSRPQRSRPLASKLLPFEEGLRAHGSAIGLRLEVDDLERERPRAQHIDCCAGLANHR